MIFLKLCGFELKYIIRPKFWKLMFYTLLRTSTQLKFQMSPQELGIIPKFGFYYQSNLSRLISFSPPP